jgi:hypothetical protein
MVRINGFLTPEKNESDVEETMKKDSRYESATLHPKFERCATVFETASHSNKG